MVEKALMVMTWEEDNDSLQRIISSHQVCKIKILGTRAKDLGYTVGKCAFFAEAKACKYGVDDLICCNLLALMAGSLCHSRSTTHIVTQELGHGHNLSAKKFSKDGAKIAFQSHDWHSSKLARSPTAWELTASDASYTHTTSPT